MADLGEFACQCYASSSTNNDESLIIKDEPISVTSFLRSETAKVRLACKFLLFDSYLTQGHFFLNGMKFLSKNFE